MRAEHVKSMLRTFSTGRGTTWTLATHIQAWFKEQQNEAWENRRLFKTPGSEGGANDETSATPPAPPNDPDGGRGKSDDGDWNLGNNMGVSGSGKGKHGRASGSKQKGSQKEAAKKGEPEAESSLVGALETSGTGPRLGTQQDVQQLFVEYSGFEELHCAMLAYISVSMDGAFLGAKHGNTSVQA